MLLREDKADIWVGGGLLALCGFAGWRATYIKQGFSSSAAGPSFVPWLVILAIAALSVLLILRGLRGNYPDSAGISMPARRTLLAMAGFTLLLIAYAIAFMPVGYLLSTVAVFVVGLLLLGERNWLLVVAFPLAMTFAIYWGFTGLLSVWLP